MCISYVYNQIILFSRTDLNWSLLGIYYVSKFYFIVTGYTTKYKKV